MARARNIKPSLFKNEILGTADPLLTILFEGLWCLADREGRLEDRPLRINAEVFPYRGFTFEQINGYLTQLLSLGFIWRYKVDDLDVIQVIKFNKHQSPHNTEKESELPPKPIENNVVTGITVKAPLNNGEITAQERSDSLLLIPDSLAIGSSEPKPRKVKEKHPDDWIQTLKKEPIYAHVDFDRELRKAEIWINDHPGRKLTATFFKNWINKIEPPIIVPKQKPLRSPEQIEAERICAESQDAFYGRI